MPNPPSPKLNTTVADLIAQARQQITEIHATDALSLLGQGDVVMVDLRDIRERQREGFIPNSFHCPRGMAEFWVDPSSPYFKTIFAEPKTFVFYCASGWRSALTVKALQDMGFQPIAHIVEGFSGWKKAGGQIEAAAAKR